VAGIKEAGAAAFLVALLEGAHPHSIFHIYFHRSAASVLEGISGAVEVPDDFDLDAKDLINLHKPDILLVGASAGWSIEKFMYGVAKSANIPIYAFIDNYMNTWQRFAHQDNAKPWFYLPNSIYVISNQMMQKMVSEGCPTTKIKIIPHPVLEKLATLPRSNESFFRANLGIGEKTTLLTLAVETGITDSDLWRWENTSSQVDNVVENILKDLLDFALLRDTQDPGSVVVLIKHHPVDTKIFSGMLDEYPTHIYRSIISVDKVALLDASTAVIGIGSMLLCEAAARGTSAFTYKNKLDVAYPNLPLSKYLRDIDSFELLRMNLDELCS
jgi:hypothetical protein